MDRIGKVNLVRNQKEKAELPVSKQCELLEVNRTSVYYEFKQGPTELESRIKNRLDELHMDEPCYGSRMFKKVLNHEDFQIGRKLVKRYMDEMGIYPIYPGPNLSKRNQKHKTYPYLLRNLAITRPDQVWSIDITYIRMHHGFLYLTAIIDWNSRYIVGWQLSDTLETKAVTDCVKRAFVQHCKPEIINCDQGSQFTSEDYTNIVKENNVKISMDGRGRALDNIIIERFWRTLKYTEVYIKDYETPKEARREIGRFIQKYNEVRLHSSLDYRTPAEAYHGTAAAIAV